MDNSLIPLTELKKIIAKDFQVEENTLPLMEDMEAVKRKLIAIIQYLLDKDINRLLNIFYRIDLNEHRVSAILAQAPVEEISTKLAELVLEREKEKISTRLKYKP